MPVTVTDWKRCFFFWTAKLENCILPAFQNFECLPPPRMKLFGNQQLECLQGHIFFQAETHIYPRPSKSPQKKVVYHIIVIVLAIFQGIWRFWVYECTCLRIYMYIYTYTWLCRQLYPTTRAFPQRSLVFFWKHTWYVYRMFFWKHNANPPIQARIC